MARAALTFFSRSHNAYPNLVSLGGRHGLRSLSQSLVLEVQGEKHVREFHTSHGLYRSSDPPRLTPQDVTETIRGNEFSINQVDGVNTEVNHKRHILPDPELEDEGPSLKGAVKSYDANTLGSNSPSEDSHAEALIKSSDTGSLFGIFDGHGGAACGQVVAKRLVHYAAAGLLSVSDLKQHIEAVTNTDRSSEHFNLLTTMNDSTELVHDLQRFYRSSYLTHIQSLLAEAEADPEEYLNRPISERLEKAFLALDEDFSREAVSSSLSTPAAAASGGRAMSAAEEKASRDIRMKTLSVALSGAVASLAHIEGADLHVAAAGDVGAVMGSLSENQTWVAKRLTAEHNSDNVNEIERISNEHPNQPMREIIRGGRLLGMLAPLRAFGDFKFKWPAETIHQVLGGVHAGEETAAVPEFYKSPPYLTCRPQVAYHRLTPKDKFLVIGSDGLWDMMTPMQVIRLVGEHMSGKTTLSPLNIEPKQNVTIAAIHSMLKKRQAAMKLKPQDKNAATHLVRCALGGTAYGVDHNRLAQMLSLPKDMVRMFRDDITVTVIFFDTEFLRHC